MTPLVAAVLAVPAIALTVVVLCAGGWLAMQPRNNTQAEL